MINKTQEDDIKRSLFTCNGFQITRPTRQNYIVFGWGSRDHRLQMGPVHLQLAGRQPQKVGCGPIAKPLSCWGRAALTPTVCSLESPARHTQSLSSCCKLQRFHNSQESRAESAVWPHGGALTPHTGIPRPNWSWKTAPFLASLQGQESGFTELPTTANAFWEDTSHPP